MPAVATRATCGAVQVRWHEWGKRDEVGLEQGLQGQHGVRRQRRGSSLPVVAQHATCGSSTGCSTGHTGRLFPVTMTAHTCFCVYIFLIRDPLHSLCIPYLGLCNIGCGLHGFPATTTAHTGVHTTQSYFQPHALTLQSIPLPPQHWLRAEWIQARRRARRRRPGSASWTASCCRASGRARGAHSRVATAAHGLCQKESTLAPVIWLRV